MISRWRKKGVVDHGDRHDMETCAFEINLNCGEFQWRTTQTRLSRSYIQKYCDRPLSPKKQGVLGKGQVKVEDNVMLKIGTYFIFFFRHFLKKLRLTLRKVGDPVSPSTQACLTASWVAFINVTFSRWYNSRSLGLGML